MWWGLSFGSQGTQGRYERLFRALETEFLHYVVSIELDHGGTERPVELPHGGSYIPERLIKPKHPFRPQMS